MSIARTYRKLKKALGVVVAVISVAVLLFFIWRAFFSVMLPSSMKTISPNDALVSAYEQSDGNLYIFGQEQRSLTSADENAGYFSAEKVIFIPSANQVQVVFRYNNSTLRYTQEDFSLEVCPERGEEVYDVTLLVCTEKAEETEETDAAEEEDDGLEYTRIFPSYSVSDETLLYNYRLFVFDLGELDFSSLLTSDKLNSIYLDVYYNGAIDYEEKPYGTLCLYDYITSTYDVKLSKDDVKAIESYLPGSVPIGSDTAALEETTASADETAPKPMRLQNKSPLLYNFKKLTINNFRNIYKY